MLSTYLPCDGNLATERSAANAATPIFQAHGELDAMIRIELARATRERLLELGYEVERHQYLMQHAVIQEEAEAIGAWLGRVLPAT